ncbi:ABC transporter substrate-binding protein [Isoptericola sp. NPDC019571]|uniref:ABC transporter substrate-binding protein n=1 Tax=Isoptericola sp. NPDC019571 TaxID=3364008 RepID=UPI00378D44B1
MSTLDRNLMDSAVGRRTFMAGSLATVALVLAGCGPSKNGGSESTGALTVMLPAFATAPDAQGELQKAITKFIGRDLDVTWVPAADYPDRVTVTMASDELPQVMAMMKKDPAFVRSAQAGAFWDLTDKLSAYKNLVAADSQVAQAASINGVQYGVFRRRDPMRACALFRADWLDELGLDVPESVDELRTVAQAFVEERPGGKKNAGMLLSQWGATYGGDSPYEMIESWFGSPNLWGERDGKLVPAFDTEEFFEAQRFLASMRKDGLLNADFATLTTVDLDNGFFTGKGGITVSTDDAMPAYAKLFDEKDPGNGYSYIANAGNLTGPAGDRHSFPTPGYSGFLAISRQSVRTEEELKGVLTVLDQLNTPEGQNLQAIGIEGKSYTLDGEFYVPVEGAEAEVIFNDASQAFYQMYTGVNGTTVPLVKPGSKGLEEQYARRDELRARDLKTAVYNAAAGLVSETEIKQGAVLNQIIGDARVKFIAGQIDEAGYRKEIERWHASGGDQIVAEINDLAAQQ